MSEPCECRISSHTGCADFEINRCPRHSEAHVIRLEIMLSAATCRAINAEAKLNAEDFRIALAKVKADRNQLILDVEDRDVLVARLRGEWPATDGSPMGIMQAKLEAMTKERDALQAIASEAALTVARLVERLKA